MRNATIVVTLKHLSNFSRSFEMQLIKSIKYCVLYAACPDNVNGNVNSNLNGNNIISFYQRHKAICS